MRDLNLFCCLASDKFDAELVCSASQFKKVDVCMTQNIDAEYPCFDCRYSNESICFYLKGYHKILLSYLDGFEN